MSTAPARIKGHYILFGGDWNEPPDSHGQYSPSWIAREGGLKISEPPRGKHGRIDYAMSDARLGRTERVVGGKSDHGLLHFDVGLPGTRRALTGVIWNVEKDRSPAQVEEMTRFLGRTLRSLGADFALLQEAKEYHRELAGLDGYALWADSAPAGAGQNVILLRDGVHARGFKVRKMTSEGWMTGTGAHAPLYTPFLTVDGWLRVASVHETVGVDWPGPTGPDAKVKARKESARKLVEAARRAGRSRDAL